MSTPAALPSAPWSTGRVVAASVFGIAAYAALAVAAVYTAGVLFLLLNKANPAQAQLTSIVRYWQLYADDESTINDLVTPVHCTVAGLMYARSLRRMATAGMVIAHVAGTEAYRSGYLLSP